MSSYEAREALVDKVERELGPFDPLHLAALRSVSRARFVRPGDESHCDEDVPLLLDDEGRATVSAPHAYLLSFRLAELVPGDVLVELGAGSGFGAALAAAIVGPQGRVTSIEIDGALARRAQAELEELPNVTVVHGDAVTAFEGLARADVRKVICTFSVEAIPGAWLRAMPDRGVLVAPVGPPQGAQRLVRVVRRGARVEEADFDAVRYVPNRSTAMSA